MKKVLFGVLILTAFSTPAIADDGCKFMLCLGSKDPRGISECKAIIDKTVKELQDSKSLKSCIMSDGRDSKTIGSYVTFAHARRTPLCPAGTIQGRDGVFYHKASKEKEHNTKPFLGFNIDKNEKGVKNVAINNDLFATDDKYVQRVCVAGQRVFKDENNEWYEDVKVLKADGASYEFNFFVDGKLYMNHRF